MTESKLALAPVDGARFVPWNTTYSPCVVFDTNASEPSAPLVFERVPEVSVGAGYESVSVPIPDGIPATNTWNVRLWPTADEMLHDIDVLLADTFKHG